jgi:DNA-binding MarR family transcriptional regulator
MTSRSRSNRASARRVEELLELFYPVHYRTGIAFEDAMRGGQLTRKQTAILWLIRFEGEQGRRMQRKAIERLLQTWFEVTSSAITKALRGMSRPPLSLIKIGEDPKSAREKQVWLTPKGEKFLQAMVAEGRKLVRRVVAQLTEEEVDAGIRYLRNSIAVFERLQQNRLPKRAAGFRKNQNVSRTSVRRFLVHSQPRRPKQLLSLTV